MKFTFSYIESEYRRILENGYTFLSCEDVFARLLGNDVLLQGETKIVVNRVDVDVSVKKALRIGLLFKKLGIPASFFFRTHASEYNLLSFETTSIVRELSKMGFEIGLHSEVIDGSAIWGQAAQEILEMDLLILRLVSGAAVRGVSSHGGLTGLNNLDHFRPYDQSNPAVDYEAYDPRLFDAGIYVSDSEWTRWKSYRHGRRLEGQLSGPADYALAGEPFIYMLIHPETYFDKHVYES